MDKIRVPQRLIGVLLVGLWGLVPSGNAWAQAEAEETQLQTQQREIDQETEPAAKQERIDALAKQFGVPASTVEDLRNKGQGWGEVTLQLSMAQHLAKTDPKTYPTLEEALTKVGTLRGEGKGWGKISKELGFKLGPVISAAKHAREEFKAEKPGKPERTERGGRPDRLNRHERFDRPEHPAHADRAKHPGR
ncbi:MAG: hypothetical protein HYZ90_01440 [Candidatus Omnitrophica bacterium]|nr:hypothetical protein [Candidatus Omnitrophota bacterium]